MKIGEVAREAGIGIDAVRFYEREGLIDKAARTPSGYRDYPPEIVAQLRFIRRAKELGFSLREISDLLSLESDAKATAADVRKLANAKLRDVQDRIRALQRIQRALRKLVDGCPGSGPTSRCSILSALNKELPS